METCDNCRRGHFARKKVDYALLGKSLGRFYALVCTWCGEKIFEGKTMLVIQQKAKAAGIWGLAAKTRVGTSGNALDVKLPKSFVSFFKLKKGAEVLLEPIDRNRFQVVIE